MFWGAAMPSKNNNDGDRKSWNPSPPKDDDWKSDHERNAEQEGVSQPEVFSALTGSPDSLEDLTASDLDEQSKKLKTIYEKRNIRLQQQAICELAVQADVAKRIQELLKDIPSPNNITGRIDSLEAVREKAEIWLRQVREAEYCREVLDAIEAGMNAVGSEKMKQAMVEDFKSRLLSVYALQENGLISGDHVLLMSETIRQAILSLEGNGQAD